MVIPRLRLFRGFMTALRTIPRRDWDDPWSEFRIEMLNLNSVTYESRYFDANLCTHARDPQQVPGRLKETKPVQE